MAYSNTIKDEYADDSIIESFECKGIDWVARVLRFEIETLFRQVQEGFSWRLRRLHYLGPLRCYPPRHIVGMFDQHPAWFSGGGQAWEELRRDADLLARVNNWLTAPDRLAKGYHLAGGRSFMLSLASIVNLKTKGKCAGTIVAKCEN